MKIIVVFRTEGQAFGVAEAEEFDGDLADDLFRLVPLANLPNSFVVQNNKDLGPLRRGGSPSSSSTRM